MSEPIRIVVADDHPLFLEGLITTLAAAEGLRVVGSATNAREALYQAREQLPDVALLDITMPGGGLQAARDIAAACPATRLVMLTASEDEDDLLAALKAGASGYILKGVSARELLHVVQAIATGEVYVAPALAWRIMGELSQPRAVGPLDELTQREREVLELVAEGLSNHEIGRRLSLAEKTVKHYMTNVLSKLQVRSRLEAALLAQKAGLGPKEPARQAERG